MRTTNADILITNGILVTVDDQNRIFRGSLAIKDGRIVALGSHDEVAREYSADKKISADDMIVMPGFFNIHNHIAGSLIRGLRATEGMKLDDLLRTVWKMQEVMDEDTFYWGSMLTCAENIKAGITTIVDHCYPFHRLAAAEREIDAFKDIGIRAAFGRGIMTLGYEPITETPDQAFRATEIIIQRVKDPKIKIMIAPVSYRQATPDDYRRARELANKYNIRLYCHCGETDEEVKMTTERWGKRPIALLEDLGFTGPDVTIVHAVKCTDEEIQMLARTGTSVCHCPANHMKLAKGVTPVKKMVDAGVNVCLGNDGPTTARQDMFGEMHQEILLQSIAHLDPRQISPSQTIRMATINGAKALGWQKEVGSLEVGKRADVILIDTKKPHLRPLLDIIQTIVYYVEGSDVDTTIIDGKIVMEKRKLLTVDEETLLQKSQEAAEAYISRAGVDHLVDRL